MKKTTSSTKNRIIVIWLLFLLVASSLLVFTPVINSAPMPGDLYYIYAAGDTTQQVWKIAVSNMTKMANSTSYGGIIYTMCADNTNVFCAGATIKKIFKYYLNNLTKITESTALFGITWDSNLFVDTGYVYVTDANFLKCRVYHKGNLSYLGTTPYQYTCSVVSDNTYFYVGYFCMTDPPSARIEKFYTSNLTYVTETPSLGSAGIGVRTICQDNYYLYSSVNDGFGTETFVYKFYKSNMTIAAGPSADYGGRIYSSSIDPMNGAYIYVGGTGGKIWKLYTSNLTKISESTSYGGNIYAVTAINGYVYAAGATTNKVYQYWGSNLTKKAESASYGGTIWSLSYSYTEVWPSPPTGFTATPDGRFAIDLAWTRGSHTSKTVIRGSTYGYPATPQSNLSVYNGTGSSYTHSGLSHSTKWYYRAWSWNDTNSRFNSTYASYNATTLSNSNPTLGTPSPINGSTNQLRTLTWSIPINDPNGDTFNWTIQCNNSQTSGINGASNGTKTISLTGLGIASPYKIWVNVTDPYGGVKKAWYTFTTHPAIVFGTLTPLNGATNIPLITNAVSVIINNPSGGLFTVKMSTIPPIGAGGTTTATVYNQVNGTKSLSINPYVNHCGIDYLKPAGVYTWYVNASYDNTWTNGTYTFTTATNTLPTISGAVTPANNTIGQSRKTSTWHFIWTQQDANGNKIDHNTTFRADNEIGYCEVNETRTMYPTSTILPPSTNYSWWINLSDGFGWSHHKYWFITAANVPPVTTATTPANHSTGVSRLTTSVVGTISDTVDPMTWWINTSLGNHATGTGSPNATVSCPLSLPLPPSTNVSWWVNASDGYNFTSNKFWFVTSSNTPPVIVSANPTSLSFNISIAITTLSVHISDTDGDYPLSWTITCSNGDSTSGGGTAGFKVLTLSGSLNYSTMYVWNVSASDSLGLWTNTSFSFQTEAAPYHLNLQQIDDMDVSQWAFGAWIYVLGSWFWGGFFGVLGAALFIKTQNAVVTSAWFLTVGIITMAVWPIDMVYMIGIICGIIIGFLFAGLIINR
jgi:hypothetical protein